MEQGREPIRIPSVLLEMSADRLRTVILNFHTMTNDEVRQNLIVTHREIYETLLFYTNESRENIPHL
jgi:hypothetical protein